MAGRTFATGDIHGDLSALLRVFDKLPKLDEQDTLVFLGDYVDRGPCSAQVVDFVRELPSNTPAKVVALRGNHEDAWLRVIDQGWPEFVTPKHHGCKEAMESYVGQLDCPFDSELDRALNAGEFFPPDVVRWFRGLPHFYEDDHAIYVHAGLHKQDGLFVHPRDARRPSKLLWLRDEDFFRNYRGKRVVFGHTKTSVLPDELSSFTPDDPADMWAGPCTVGLDTGAGKGGFLTTLEMPSMRVFESR